MFASVKPTTRSGALALGLCALVALSTSACSLRFDFTECTTAADCQKFDGSGSFYTCGASNTCVIEQGVECRSNADCTDSAKPTCDTQNKCVAGDGMDMGMDMGADMTDMPVDMEPDRTCTKNSECIERFDEAHICGPGGMCTAVNPELCSAPKYPKNGEQDNVAFISSLIPLAEPYGALLGEELMHGVDMSVKNFNDEASLPGGKKIAWISCDSKGSPSHATTVAKHLINDLGIQAMIGPVFSESVLAVSSDVNNNEVFMITPTATSPAITEQRTKDKNFIWRNIASDVFQGAAFVKRVQDLGLNKVLILYKDDKYGRDLQAQIAPALQALRGNENIKVAKYENPLMFMGADAEMERQAAYRTVISSSTVMAGFDPDGVIILGTSEGVEMGAIYIGMVNALGGMLSLPSKMLFSHGATPVLPLFVGATAPSLAPLVEGIAPEIGNPSSPEYGSFATQYIQDYGGSSGIITATTTFDSTAVAMLAMCSIPEAMPITGKNISDAVGKLVDKQAQSEDQITFFVTTSYFSKACNKLQANRSVDIAGPSGTLDFDVTRGEVYSRFVGWDLRENAAMTGYDLYPTRILYFTDPPNTDGMWMNIPMP